VAGLFLPTAIAGWAPILHWSCDLQTRIASEFEYVPVVLTNSPFGGNASSEGILPASFPGGVGYPTEGSFETDIAENGSSSGTFNTVELNVYRVQTALTWGPGPTQRCSQPFAVVPSEPNPSGIAAGWPVAVPSNLSDRGEASQVIFHGFSGTPLSVIFDNGFTTPNEANVSTCNRPAEAVPLPANTDHLVVAVPFSWNGRNYTTPMQLPFIESYTYHFPANFGTWQVDNLSAPGGPGGGWAFSYSPCPWPRPRRLYERSARSMGDRDGRADERWYSLFPFGTGWRCQPESASDT
jgi:hypothetical protein